MTMMKKISLLLTLSLLLHGAAIRAYSDSDKRELKVMTRNMDAGTDLNFFFVEGPLTAAADTFTEVLRSDIPGRAALLANEIAAEQPDLIGLQEVSLYQTVLPGQVPT